MITVGAASIYLLMFQIMPLFREINPAYYKAGFALGDMIGPREDIYPKILYGLKLLIPLVIAPDLLAQGYHCRPHDWRKLDQRLFTYI